MSVSGSTPPARCAGVRRIGSPPIRKAAVVPARSALHSRPPSVGFRSRTASSHTSSCRPVQLHLHRPLRPLRLRLHLHLHLHLHHLHPPPPGSLPNSPLPFLGFEGDAAVSAPFISGAVGPQGVVSGTVTINTLWTPFRPSNTSLTLQWLLDGAPLSGYITDSTPFLFSYSWNTTGTTDGTHVITARFIYISGQIYGTIKSMGIPVIVQNSGPINGSQTLAVSVAPVHHPVPGRPDFVTYNGVPNSPNDTHDHPAPTVGFIPPLAGDVAGRNYYNWRADDPAEPRALEYQFNVR